MNVLDQISSVPYLRGIIIAVAAVVILVIAFAGIKKRRNQQRLQPLIGDIDELYDDDEFEDPNILAVRKMSDGQDSENEWDDVEIEEYHIDPLEPVAELDEPEIEAHEETIEPIEEEIIAPAPQQQPAAAELNDLLVVNIFSSAGSQFIGYDLLQALLSAGMRFGEMNIFHRHQDKSGRGPVIFSLASATEPGTFDIQKMGAFSCTGLSMFLQLRHDEDDVDNFNTMLDTAKQLANDLNGHLFDMRRAPLTEELIAQYRQQISEAVVNI